jgi:hypothetical protein
MLLERPAIGAFQKLIFSEMSQKVALNLTQRVCVLESSWLDVENHIQETAGENNDRPLPVPKRSLES